jgi:hypothetical protein
VSDEADLKELLPNQQTVNSDHWSIDSGQRRIMAKKLHDFIGGLQENDLVITGDLDEIPYADVLNVLKHCQPAPGRLPISLGSQHSYRYNFNWALTDYPIDVPAVTPGSTANELVQQGKSFRGDAPPATKLKPFSTHCTTFGDMTIAVLKLISISEGRDKVPGNNVRMMSHPFEVAKDTIAVGLGPVSNRHGANERTMQSLGWVGPIMCRCGVRFSASLYRQEHGQWNV